MQTRAEEGPLLNGEPGHDIRDDTQDPLSAETEHTHDRWHWRRRIRANPHQLFWYRIVIAILGLACMAAGVVTGPLPGPGGIPLVLLGLAIWASEFRWAHLLMEWFKARVHQVRGLTPGKKALFWLCFAACCGLLGYLGMLLLGLPGWLPGPLRQTLTLLPGVD